ncbi:DNA gyrase C-terminal repeat, beta-propeller [Thermosinus carboxydivorans Nor1]|uniref:DNA gyrase C-terminal repeat, beta-propeller n=1 Tax=Thermosinus carboxydivorans Nor1 TaxID=401526 RepID=A1HLR1_9FIRM|nr:DNA gyrase C-terminal repeat, beta-propeller [Thermosinus carboxydivorans Nor1]
MATKKGIVKKTELLEFDTARKIGLIALTLDEDDELIDVKLTNGEQHILLGTRDGMAINFPESQVRVMGRTAHGVKGITLRDGDVVVGMDTVKKDGHVLTVTEAGYGKRTPVEEYRQQSRGGKGLINNKITEKTGKVIGLKVVRPGQELMLITGDGVVIRTKVDEISVTGRNTQGVKVMSVGENDRVVALAAVDKKSDSD